MSGSSEFGRWSKSSPGFTQIVSAMSKCGLKKSLKYLNIFGCGGINTNQAKKVLNDYDMANVTVINQIDWPSGL